jgi:hypothetical protein
LRLIRLLAVQIQPEYAIERWAARQPIFRTCINACPRTFQNFAPRLKAFQTRASLKRIKETTIPAMCTEINEAAQNYKHVS